MDEEQVCRRCCREQGQDGAERLVPTSLAETITVVLCDDCRSDFAMWFDRQYEAPEVSAIRERMRATRLLFRSPVVPAERLESAISQLGEMAKQEHALIRSAGAKVREWLVAGETADQDAT